MAGLIMGLIVVGLIGLVGLAVFSSSDESEGSGVSVATRDPLEGMAPDKWTAATSLWGSTTLMLSGSSTLEAIPLR